MKKIATSLLIAFLFLPLFSFAQVGYLGKKFDIQYAPTFGNPWLQNYMDGSSLETDGDSYIIDGAKDYPSIPRFNATRKNRKSNFLNIKHRLLLNYTFSTKSAIGVGIHFGKYGIYERDIALPNADSTYFEQIESSGNIESTEMALRYTYFKGKMAPIGSYMTISLGINRIKSYVIAKGMPEHFKENNRNIPYLGLDIGKNVLIGNGLYLNIGVAMHFSTKYLAVENYRIFQYNIFRPTIGIGYIPF